MILRDVVCSTSRGAASARPARASRARGRFWPVALLAAIVLAATSPAAAEKPCTETSCEQEFQFVFTGPDGGHIRDISLLVEKPMLPLETPVIGFFEDHYGGLGDQWRASAWIAMTFAALQGYDVNRYIRYRADWSSIDGPSASGALTIALLAALDRRRLLPTVVMTGSLNPDGTIGTVGGLVDKVKAAAAFKRRDADTGQEVVKEVVLIPAGQLGELTSELYWINKDRQGDRLPPLCAVEVQNLAEAYVNYTGQSPDWPTAKDPANAAELPEDVRGPLLKRLQRRKADIDFLVGRWSEEEPTVSAARIRGLAEEAARQLGVLPAPAAEGLLMPAYERSMQAIEMYYAAVAGARWLKTDVAPLSLPSLAQDQRVVSGIMENLKTKILDSPTAISMYAELRGMVGLIDQHLIRAARAKEDWERARTGLDRGDAARRQAEEQAVWEMVGAQARVVGLQLRVADFFDVLTSMAPPRRSINFDAVFQLRRLLTIAAEANLAYFAARHGCRARTEGLCGRGDRILGYQELAAMQEVLTPTLRNTARRGEQDQLYLGLALESYLGSSLLVHEGYGPPQVPSSSEMAEAAPGPQVPLESTLTWARDLAVRIVETVESGADRRAVIPRLYIQMANVLSRNPDLPSRLQALAFFWRASAHGHLMRAITGVTPTPATP